MIEEFKKRYEDACAEMKEAVEKERAARNAYMESRQTRAGHIHAKIQSIQAEIDAEKEANTLRPQQIANALGNSNDKLAEEIEKEISVADGRIAALERKRELFENTEPKGEQSLFDIAVSLHREKRKAALTVSDRLSKLSINVSEIIHELERIEADADSARERFFHYRRNDGNMIAMVEAHEGVIDVTGSHAGTDENAKQRYIDGVLAGLEDSPAGKKLAAKLAVEASAQK